MLGFEVIFASFFSACWAWSIAEWMPPKTLPAVNAQYNLAAPGSIPIRIAAYQRRRMFEIFLSSTNIQESDSVLDLGATSDQTYSHSNYFEAWYPYKHRICACGVDDASFLEQMYPGLQYVAADRRGSPLP